MKKIKLIFSIVFLLAVTISCSDESGIDTNDAIDTTPTSEVSNIFEITNDNSGDVRIKPSGNSVALFMVAYGDAGNGVVTLTPGKSIVHSYAEGTYTVTITAQDIAGVKTTQTYPLVVKYRAPEDLKITNIIEGNDIVVSAEAKYARSFLVYYGDVPNEVGTPMAIDEELAVHEYPGPGVYNLKVVALSGGAPITEEVQVITIYAPFSLPITFENPVQNYGGGGTFGGVGVGVIANPFSGGINTSTSVWQYTKPAGAESWSGTYTPVAKPNGVPININNGKIFKVMVYATETGKMLNLEIEKGGSNEQLAYILKMPITVANQWQELVFDFSSAGIPAGTTFNQLVFRYNDAEGGKGEVIYMDNVTQNN